MVKNIPIFFSCDDKYVPFLAVALTSLEKNANPKYHYLIKVLHANSITPANQTQITKSYSVNNFDVEFVNIADAVAAFSNQFYTRDYYSKSTYYRLFIANLYPQFNKALYLDSDIVVLGDIAQLYNKRLGTNLVGAIPDESVQLVPEFQEYVVNRIGVATPRHYFNAGILLMNLKQLRAIKFQEIFLSMMRQVTFDVAQDQDYLNAICRGRVRYIAGGWDKMPFPNDQIKAKDIRLIHFNLDKKPWQQDDVLYEKYFWQYAKQTAYYDAILQHKAQYSAAQQQASQAETVALMQRTHDQAQDTAENQRIAAIIRSVCNFPTAEAQ